MYAFKRMLMYLKHVGKLSLTHVGKLIHMQASCTVSNGSVVKDEEMRGRSATQQLYGEDDLQ